MKALVAVLLLALSSVTFAAEDFRFWTQRTVDGVDIPQTVGTHRILQTMVEPNASGFDSVEVIVRLDELVPDAATPANAQYEVAVVIETRIDMEWTAIAYQFNGTNNTDLGLRVIQITPSPVLEVGVDNVVQVAGKNFSQISTNQGTLSGAFRLALYVTQKGTDDPLTSITISAWGRKYNAQ